MGRDDQQDGVGTGGAGLEDLKWIEDEVLAKAGIFTAPRGRCEIFKRALEELLIGKNGERCGPCGLKGTG